MPAPTQAPVKEFKSLLEDTFPDDTSLPPFMVSTTRGFLPRQVVSISISFDIHLYFC